jgi:predicted metal-dependent phosphotriesterase family hydrolase
MAYIFEQFIPRLRKEGFPAQQIDAILVDNPARAFAFRQDRQLAT